jgi:hypothetical protein
MRRPSSSSPRSVRPARTTSSPTVGIRPRRATIRPPRVPTRSGRNCRTSSPLSSSTSSSRVSPSSSSDPSDARRAPGRPGGWAPRRRLVVDLAHQRLDQILDGDNARRPAVLVDDRRELTPLGLHLFKQDIGGDALWHRQHRVQQRVQVEVGRRAGQHGDQVADTEHADASPERMRRARLYEALVLAKITVRRVRLFDPTGRRGPKS